MVFSWNRFGTLALAVLGTSLTTKPAGSGYDVVTLDQLTVEEPFFVPDHDLMLESQNWTAVLLDEHLTTSTIPIRDPIPIPDPIKLKPTELDAQEEPTKTIEFRIVYDPATQTFQLHCESFGVYYEAVVDYAKSYYNSLDFRSVFVNAFDVGMSYYFGPVYSAASMVMESYVPWDSFDFDFSTIPAMALETAQFYYQSTMAYCRSIVDSSRSTYQDVKNNAEYYFQSTVNSVKAFYRAAMDSAEFYYQSAVNSAKDFYRAVVSYLQDKVNSAKGFCMAAVNTAESYYQFTVNSAKSLYKAAIESIESFYISVIDLYDYYYDAMIRYIKSSCSNVAEAAWNNKKKTFACMLLPVWGCFLGNVLKKMEMALKDMKKDFGKPVPNNNKKDDATMKFVGGIPKLFFLFVLGCALVGEIWDLNEHFGHQRQQQQQWKPRPRPTPSCPLTAPIVYDFGIGSAEIAKHAASGKWAEAEALSLEFEKSEWNTDKPVKRVPFVPAVLGVQKHLSGIVEVEDFAEMEIEACVDATKLWRKIAIKLHPDKLSKDLTDEQKKTIERIFKGLNNIQSWSRKK